MSRRWRYPPTGRGRGEDDRKGLGRVSATQREQEKVLNTTRFSLAGFLTGIAIDSEHF